MTMIEYLLKLTCLIYEYAMSIQPKAARSKNCIRTLLQYIVGSIITIVFTQWQFPVRKLETADVFCYL